MAPRKKAPPKPISLNPEQTLAVNAGSGVWAVAAGPGAGKSTLLLARYVRLLNEGVIPNDVLGLTFTSAAAKNLRDRVDEQTTVQKMDTRVAGFITFHSLCLSICTKERDKFGFHLADFPLASEAQARKLIIEQARKFELDWKSLGSWISRQRRDAITPADALKTAEKEGKDEKQALAYKAFDSALRRLGVLDFDTMVMEVVALLGKDSEVRNRWQFTWIMVDEAQDCDTSQFRLTQLISMKHGNVMFIGDSGQSCYGFRGARSDLFRNLSSLFPNVRTLYLGQNYRSSPEIVSFVKDISTDEQLAEHFHTHNPSGPEPRVVGFPSSIDQAQHIVRNADVDAACLSRTNRGLADIENALSVAGIKYKLLGKCGFYQQAEIKLVCAYLQCILNPLDHSVLAALRGPFHVTKYIKKKELADELKNKQKSDPNKPTIWYLMNRHVSPDPNQARALNTFTQFIMTLGRHRDQSASDVVKKVIQELRAVEHYQEEGDPDNYPVENLGELVKTSKRFGSLKDFMDYIRKVSAATRSKKAFTLSTIHGAKGLQWNKVLVASVNDGVLPHSKGDLEEEKNLYFIACSRPERELHVLYHGIPSPFIKVKKSEESVEEVFA